MHRQPARSAHPLFASPLHAQRETRNQNNFENVYALQELAEPTARRIRELDSMLGGAPSHPPSSATALCFQGLVTQASVHAYTSSVRASAHASV